MTYKSDNCYNDIIYAGLRRRRKRKTTPDSNATQASCCEWFSKSSCKPAVEPRTKEVIGGIYYSEENRLSKQLDFQNI